MQHKASGHTTILSTSCQLKTTLAKMLCPHLWVLSLQDTLWSKVYVSLCKFAYWMWNYWCRRWCSKHHELCKWAAVFGLVLCSKGYCVESMQCAHWTSCELTRRALYDIADVVLWWRLNCGSCCECTFLGLRQQCLCLHTFTHISSVLFIHK